MSWPWPFLSLGREKAPVQLQIQGSNSSLVRREETKEVDSACDSLQKLCM